MTDQDSDDVRARLLDLLEADEWQFSERAKREGVVALRWLRDREPTSGEMVVYIIKLLKSELPLRCAPQGDPPGSTGIAWQLCDAKNIFVKLQIKGGFGDVISDEYAYVQSIHVTNHPK